MTNGSESQHLADHLPIPGHALLTSCQAQGYFHQCRIGELMNMNYRQWF